jgi:hypothetical protein
MTRSRPESKGKGQTDQGLTSGSAWAGFWAQSLCKDALDEKCGREFCGARTTAALSVPATVTAAALTSLADGRPAGLSIHAKTAAKVPSRRSPEIVKPPAYPTFSS